MQAGMMRERVTIKRAQVTTDATGQQVYAYNGTGQQTDTVWASVRSTNQRKDSAGESQPIGAETFEVRIRHRTDVDYDTRLIWGNRTLEVVAIENVRNLNHELRLQCEEVGL